MRHPLKFQRGELIIFAISIIFWTVLIFYSEVALICDANLFNKLGWLIHEQGLRAYIAQGPIQEPLFPLLISFSIGLGKTWGVPYLLIQKGFQAGFLLFTQILMALILRQSHVPKRFSYPALLYFGFSPAIVNSGLSLFSEVMVYPFVLGMVLSAYLCWRAVFSQKGKQLLPGAVAFAVCGVFSTFVKGAFELITPVFLFPFLIALVDNVRHPNKTKVKYLLLFFSIFTLIFYGSIITYKLVNKNLNGVYTLTNRGPWALYGNLRRRGQNMNLDRILTAVAYLPGERFCEKVRGAEKCEFWSPVPSDKYGYELLYALRTNGFDLTATNKILVWRALGLLTEKPLQQAGFWCLEWGKIFFWESMRIGYVTYPALLEKAHNITALNYFLRGILAVLTFCAFVLILKQILTKKPWRVKPGQDNDGQLMVFFVFAMICSYVSVLALFLIFIRYLFPLVPFFLTCIAFSAQKVLGRKA